MGTNIGNECMAARIICEGEVVVVLKVTNVSVCMVIYRVVPMCRSV